MIQLRTCPINTRPASSMRAALNSKYCLRAQILARTQVNGQINEQANGEFFSYQKSQHRVVSNRQKSKNNGNGRLHLPEEVKITKTKIGKRWSTSSMEVELTGDILEVRDGLDKIVDTLVLTPSPH